MTDPPDASRAQIRGSTLLLGGQAFALVANLVTQILLVRHLTKDSYGAFAYALSIVAIAEAVAAFGLRRGVARFVPRYEERGEVARAAGTLAMAAGIVAGLGLAVVLVVLGLRDMIAGGVASGGEAAALLAVLILLAPVNAFETLLDGAFAVFARPRAIAARKHLFTPVARLVIVGAVVLTDGDAKSIAVGYLAAGAIGVVVYGGMLGRLLAERGLLEPLRRRRLEFPVREVLGFTVPLLTTDLAAVLLGAAATVLLGALATAADVADFRAVLPLALTMTYVLSSFGLLFVPLASRLLERGDPVEVDRLYWQTAAWTAVFSLPVFLVAFTCSEDLTVAMFGERYAGAGEVLAALVVGHFVSAALGPNGVLLGVYGQVRFIVGANLASVVVTLALSAPMIAAYGAWGAAVAASASQIVLNVGRQIGLGRRTDVRAVNPEVMRLYALMAVAAGVLLAIQLTLSPPLVAGVVLAGAAWAGIFAVARRQLDLAGTFPEIARLPLIGRLASR